MEAVLRARASHRYDRGAVPPEGGDRRREQAPAC
jgi:hypothetical protein